MAANFMIFNQQTTLVELIYTYVCTLLTFLLECFIKVMIFFYDMTGKDSQPHCNSLPIMPDTLNCLSC